MPPLKSKKKNTSLSEEVASVIRKLFHLYSQQVKADDTVSSAFVQPESAQQKIVRSGALVLQAGLGFLPASVALLLGANKPFKITIG